MLGGGGLQCFYKYEYPLDEWYMPSSKREVGKDP